jgi:hypothetical protein
VGIERAPFLEEDTLGLEQWMHRSARTTGQVEFLGVESTQASRACFINVGRIMVRIPQGLKPLVIPALLGTTEVVP